MAQKNRANMLTDIVSNIYNNLINFITGQNAQDRFVNLLDSSPNILSDASQANGYVSTDANNEMFSSYYDEEISRADLITDLTANLAVGGKFYRINDAVGTTITLLVTAESNINLYPFGIDATTGEIGTYDITTDVFSPIVSSAQTLSDTLILGNTSGANDIEFDATQGLLFDNASRLREGTIDAGLGGLKGIAQICGAGYELKWENGRLYVMGSSGNTIRQSLYNLTTTPTVTDDDTLGYSVGSLWTLDDGTVYVCSDATTGAAVWAIGGIPTIQQVLDAGNVSTTGLRIEDGAGNEVTIADYYVQILNPLGGIAVISSPTLDESVTFELPDKPAGTETFAMLSDVSTPNIQQVLDEGNTSTTAIKIDNGTGNYVQVNSSNILMEDSSGNALSVYPDSMTIQNPSFGAGTIKATALANNVTFELPNKAAGTQTFAMLSDISGGGGDVYLANDQTFTGENTFAIPSGSKEPIIITKGGNGAGLKVTKSSGSGDAIEVAQGSVSISDETASTIASFDGSKRIKSLATSTYPSLTELARVKGVGSQVVGTTDTNTLTNKRITARTGTTTSSATPTINTDNVDFYSLTAQAVDITSFTTNLSGTPSDGQTLWIAITGTAARAITWGASFESSTITLPTTTVTTNRLDVAFIWNVVSGKWRCVGVA
jgi:hypothetical protein